MYICKKMLSIYDFTEYDFFASSRAFQNGIPYDGMMEICLLSST